LRRIFDGSGRINRIIRFLVAGNGFVGNCRLRRSLDGIVNSFLFV
jgi:hypothetical protein